MPDNIPEEVNEEELEAAATDVEGHASEEGRSTAPILDVNFGCA